MNKFPRIVIAGLKGGSGKTTVSIGLIAALRERGLDVSPFKKGPDYIDAGWLSAAAGRPCYNLDPFLIGHDKVLSSFTGHFMGDIAVIEGNRGLFDGMDMEGSLSTANVAKALKAPVLLIVDCSKATRTLSAVVLGVKRFDPKVRLMGIILNHIAGRRHESVVRGAIERYCGVAVVGAIPRMEEKIPERHMGLTPHQEHPKVKEAIKETASLIKKHLDLDAIVEIAEGAPPLRAKSRPEHMEKPVIHLKIGVIRDSAFQFYYPENIEALRERGAETIEFSAIKEKHLPPLDALYIGGGFPETHAIALSRNTSLRRSLLKAIEAGLPVYAECGGLMYLGESLIMNGRKYPMTGVLPIGFSLERKPQAHGYTISEITGKNPFYPRGAVLEGHEFHYSMPSYIGKKPGMRFTLKMRRGEGIRDKADGLCYRNVFATYTHVHALGAGEWAEGMLKAAMSFRTKRLER